MQMKPININSPSVDYTVSSTSTAYQMPQFTGSVRIVNSSGGVVYFKAGESSSVSVGTITAGQEYIGAKIADNTTEVFTVDQKNTHIAIYAPSATGTVTIQYGDGV